MSAKQSANKEIPKASEPEPKQEKMEPTQAEGRNENGQKSSKGGDNEKPSIKKLVSGPAEFMGKTARSGANLTKKVVTTTKNNVGKVVSPKRRNRGFREEGEEGKEHQPPLTKEKSIFKEAAEALEKPIIGAEKALERPAGHKYMKVSPTQSEDEAEVRPEDARCGSPLDCIKETFEKPFVETEQALERPERRKYMKVDKNPITEETATIEADRDATQENLSVYTSTEVSGLDKKHASELSLDSADASVDTMKEIVIGPVIAFLLRDSTIMVVFAIILAATPTYMYWNFIDQNQIPLPVSIGWLVAAFVLGQELGRLRGARAPVSRGEAVETSLPGASTVAPRRHTMFRRATQNMQNATFKFSDEEPEPPMKRGNRFWRGIRFRRFGRKRRRESWKDNITPSKSSPLRKWLNNDPTIQHRHSTLKPVQEEAEEIVSTSVMEDLDTSASSLGAFDLTSNPAKTLADEGVEPLLDLIGMDIFLTGENGPEDDLGSHPFLIENGLREKSTCLVNVMLPWANMIIYFGLPDWFECWDSIVEDESDPEDVKILKRFLNGTDDYRQKRLKILPAIVDGPRIIKILAPSKVELSLPKDLVPVTYNKVDEAMVGKGVRQCPMIEVELDLMSSKAIRTVANVFKNHFHRITLDLAVLIRDPDGPSCESCACLGMWRFDQIEVSDCPKLPIRDVPEEEVIRRASAMISLSQKEMATIAEEAIAEEAISVQ